MLGPAARLIDPTRLATTAGIERERAKLLGVNRHRDLSDLLDPLHDALWPCRVQR